MSWEPTPTSVPIPIKLGPYRLLHRIATGGMGEVFLGVEEKRGQRPRVVAVKRLLPHLNSRREAVRLFLDEARIVARLSHPSITPILDLGESDGSYFIAMEYVPGMSGRQLIERLAEGGQRLDPVNALKVAAEVGRALAYAHTAKADGNWLQIVHRDVSPRNVLLSKKGEVKLIDFGVAKSSEQFHHTELGKLKGKLAYMSPEQAAGRTIDGRSDLFALTIVLSELLTSQHPFMRREEYAILLAIQKDPPNLPSASYDDLAPIDAFVARNLSKDPGDRLPDGNAYARELDSLAALYPRPRKDLGLIVSILADQEVEDISQSIVRAQKRFDQLDPARGEQSDMSLLLAQELSKPPGLAADPMAKTIRDPTKMVDEPGPEAPPARRPASIGSDDDDDVPTVKEGSPEADLLPTKPDRLIIPLVKKIKR